MRLRLLAAIGLITGLLVAAAPAGAFVIAPVPMLSATNGIVLGPDGNFWIAEQASGTVARMTPAGTVIDRFTVGANPTTVANGPGGRVWVAVTSASKLVRIDATSSPPTLTDVPTGGAGTCGPAGLVAGADGRMYFSLPTVGACTGGNVVNSVDAAGAGMSTPVATPGPVFDLASAGGTLFAPGPAVGVVARYALGAPVVQQASIQAGSGPKGVAIDGAANVWVTDSLAGNLLRFPVGLAGGNADLVPLAGGTLGTPFGIVASPDGGMYVAGFGSQNIARVATDGSPTRFFAAPDAAPYRIVNGADSDLWITDQARARVLHFVNTAPRVSTDAAAAGSATATVSATVDPRGNDTTLVFDYGKTSDYGSSSAPVIVAAGITPVATDGAIKGLAPSTTYHVRARASNSQGVALGADLTFRTTAAPPSVPRLKATTSFGYLRRGPSTVVVRIALAKLVGGETTTIRCTGKRCAFKARVFKKLKKGKRIFGRSLLKARRLPAGTTVSVQVTKPGTVGTSTVLKVRQGKGPQITRRCLPPGAKKPTACT